MASFAPCTPSTTGSSCAHQPCTTAQGWVLRGASGTGELREGQEEGRFPGQLLETARGSLDKLPCLLCRIGLQGRAQNRGSFRAGCDRERSSSPGELCCRLEHCLWAAAAGLLREREPVLLELPECLFVGLVKE